MGRTQCVIGYRSVGNLNKTHWSDPTRYLTSNVLQPWVAREVIKRIGGAAWVWSEGIEALLKVGNFFVQPNKMIICFFFDRTPLLFLSYERSIRKLVPSNNFTFIDVMSHSFWISCWEGKTKTDLRWSCPWRSLGENLQIRGWWLIEKFIVIHRVFVLLSHWPLFQSNCNSLRCLCLNALFF